MKLNPSHTVRSVCICLPLLFAASGIAQAGGSHGHGHATQAIGVAGDAAKVTRTINIDMTDAMRFIPAEIQAKRGETIRFVIKNSGKLKHEFVLGTEAALKEHYEVMKKSPEMEHNEPNMITLAPGGSGEVIWRFTQAGKVDFGCLQPGHYDAGMKGAVTVGGKKAKARASGANSAGGAGSAGGANSAGSHAGHSH